MSDDNELVFAPLGGLGEIGMNCALYGFGPAERPQMADGRSRPRLRRRGIAGRRSDPARPRLHREGRRRTSSASSSPTRMRTISARSSTSGRGSACRSTRRASPPASLEARRLSEPGAPENSDRDRRPGRAGRRRPVRRRVHRGRPFDPRELRAGDPHAGRARRAHRRLEDRRDAADRRADRRSAPARRSATRACSR